MDKSGRKTTKASAVADNLRSDIINGVFAPGEKLRMVVLKDRYGAGYSPIREALSRLVTYGLVNIEEQCGFNVALQSLSELYDLYEIRKYIETLALERSIKYGDDQWEADIISSWHQLKKALTPEINKFLDPIKWEKLQRKFLYSLVKSCQSPWLLKIRDILYDQSDRYRSICINANQKNKQFFAKYIKENEQLIAAVLNRNVSKAVKISELSWKNTVSHIEQILKK